MRLFSTGAGPACVLCLLALTNGCHERQAFVTIPPPVQRPTIASNSPLVIPTPKRLCLVGPPFLLNAQTCLVVADDATAQDKMAALAVQEEAQWRFGLPQLRIVRARTLQGETQNAVVFGEIRRVPLAARLLRRVGAIKPTKAEGYCIRVTPHWAVVVGHDPRGTFYGAQTLCQLLEHDGHGAAVTAAQIDDYPTLAWRGAHLFLGDQALPFHKRLIARVFARLKFNNLVLECEQARWDTLGRDAPPWAMSKNDLAQELAFARRHFMTVTPLVNQVGHMPWLLSDPKHRTWAEDPQTPYAADVTDPAVDSFLFRLDDEVLDTFHSTSLHIGGDEVTQRGRYPYRSRARYPTVAQAYVAQVTRIHDHLKHRGVRTLLWADMLLAPGEAPDFTNAPNARQAWWMRTHLPHDIGLIDWHYAPRGPYPSPRLFQAAGFSPVIGATWYDPNNVASYSRALADDRARGLLQTTWAGYNSRAENLTHESRQFTAFVIAAEQAWNGGRVPQNRLPYDPAQVFWRLYGERRQPPSLLRRVPPQGRIPTRE